MNIVEEIKKMNAENVKDVFVDFIYKYTNPAFGSMSKRDIDILLFTKLQELKVFGKDPEIYEMVSSLKITRTKARNILYEAKLRNTTKNELDNELKDLLSKPIFFKDNDKIAIEISNPLLIDHLKSILKEKNYITDGSFSPEIVKLTKDAYISLIDNFINKEKQEAIRLALNKEGIISDISFKNIISKVLKELSTKFVGDMGEDFVNCAEGYLKTIIFDNAESIANKLTTLLKK